MRGKELSGDRSDAAATVEHALRVKRAVRLAEQELGRGDLIDPLVEAVRGAASRVVRKIRSNQ